MFAVGTCDVSTAVDDLFLQGYLAVDDLFLQGYLTSKCTPQGPYGGPMPRVLSWS